MGFRVTTFDEIDKMLSVREELGIAKAGFLAGGIRSCDQDRTTARGRHAAQTICSPKENDAVSILGAAHGGIDGLGSVAEHQGRSPHKIDSLQFAAGEECDRLTIRRPEGQIGTLGSRQLACRE